MNTKSKEERARTLFTKRLVMNCVRNTMLEDIHAGVWPHSETGDYTDVSVIGATGKEIRWNELSRISDEEMKALMKSVVDRVYTVLSRIDDPDFAESLCVYDGALKNWDTPRIDHKLIEHLASMRDLFKDKSPND